MRLYDTPSGQGILHNGFSDTVWAVNVHSALKQGYWEAPPSPDNLTAEQRRSRDVRIESEDWLRAKRWDLPTDYREFRAVVTRAYQDPGVGGLLRFLHSPAARPMPVELLRECVDELEAAVVPVPDFVRAKLIENKKA